MSKNVDGTCVLIHGYRWGTPDWEHVMWGNIARREFGRIVRGIEVALKRDGHVYWGGGEDVGNFFAFTREREQELVSLFGNGVTNILDNRSVLGVGGGQTETEVQEALALCQRGQLTNLVLVSDKVHLERCSILALRAKEDARLRDHIDIVLMSSDTTFSDQAPVHYEPPTAYRDNLHDVVVDLLKLDRKLNGNVAEARTKLHALISELMK